MFGIDQFIGSAPNRPQSIRTDIVASNQIGLDRFRPPLRQAQIVIVVAVSASSWLSLP